jgi:hypothetical protein
MSTSAREHSGFDMEPVVDTRLHRVLLSLAVGALLAAVTVGYMFAIAAHRGNALWADLGPFVVVASVVGVGVPTYLAAGFFHGHDWLKAAAASCLALSLGFMIFWSAAMVAATDTTGVHVAESPAVLYVKFDPLIWRTDVTARLAMARDLCTGNRLQGLTPAQVRTQLGDPMVTVGPGIREMCYALTPPATATATATSDAARVLLRVLFSSSGRVASVAVAGD